MSGGGKQACLGYNYAHNIGYMEGIVANILSRLPVKHILDSKLVSKFWHRLIDEPQFAQLHFNRSRDEQKFIFYLDCGHAEPKKKLYLMDKTGKISPYVTLPSLQWYSFDFISSFNGLLCFTKSLGVGGNDLDIYICNPVTREVLKLPKGSRSTNLPLIGIVFDPNKNKYKVLRSFHVTNESKGTAIKYEIYSPGDVDWRVIDGLMELPASTSPRPLLPPHVCIGGRMYWLAFSVQGYRKPDIIISIDMDENITKIRLPEKYSDKSEKYLDALLINYKGRLGVVDIDGDDETEVSIWILKNLEESSWENRKSAVLQTDHCINGINSIVSLENKLFLVSSQDGHIFHLPNLDEKTWRLSKIAFICEECDDGEFSCVLYGIHIPVVFPFSESLFRCDASN